MTISIRGTAGTMVASSPEELALLAMAEAGAEVAEANQAQRAASREARTEAQRAQITLQFQANEQDMWSGVAAGIGTIANGAAQVASGSVRLESAGRIAGAPEADREDLRSQLQGRTDSITGYAGATKGGLDVLSTVIGRDAADTRTRATRAEHAAEAADEVRRDAEEDQAETTRGIDRQTQALRDYLGEKRRSEEAATRA